MVSGKRRAAEKARETFFGHMRPNRKHWVTTMPEDELEHSPTRRHLYCQFTQYCRLSKCKLRCSWPGSDVGSGSSEGLGLGIGLGIGLGMESAQCRVMLTDISGKLFWISCMLTLKPCVSNKLSANYSSDLSSSAFFQRLSPLIKKYLSLSQRITKDCWWTQALSAVYSRQNMNWLKQTCCLLHALKPDSFKPNPPPPLFSPHGMHICNSIVCISVSMNLLYRYIAA